MANIETNSKDYVVELNELSHYWDIKLG